MREHMYNTQETNRGRYTIRGEDEGTHLQNTEHRTLTGLLLTLSVVFEQSSDG